jgi:hypothetical protein
MRWDSVHKRRGLPWSDFSKDQSKRHAQHCELLILAEGTE